MGVLWRAAPWAGLAYHCTSITTLCSPFSQCIRSATVYQPLDRIPATRCPPRPSVPSQLDINTGGEQPRTKLRLQLQIPSPRNPTSSMQMSLAIRNLCAPYRSAPPCPEEALLWVTVLSLPIRSMTSTRARL